MGFLKEDIDRIYDAYPRKRAPETAKKAILKALQRIEKEQKPLLDGRNVDPVEYLLERTLMFYRARKQAGQDAKFTPMPATWFNSGDYAGDPLDWQRSDNTQAAATRFAESRAHAQITEQLSDTLETLKHLRLCGSESKKKLERDPGNLELQKRVARLRQQWTEAENLRIGLQDKLDKIGMNGRVPV